MSGGPGPPPLTSFGLRLCHDGRFLHEGQPILNRKLREHFERSVEYLPVERKYIVRLKHFRGQLDLEEAGFFVRSVDLATGEIDLSDGSREPLDLSTLATSPIDGAWTCRVKRHLEPEGLLARFTHAAQAEMLHAVESEGEGYVVVMRGERLPLPDLEDEAAPATALD